MLVKESDLVRIKQLLLEGAKEAAVQEMEAVLDIFWADVVAEGGAWNYSGEELGTELQQTLEKVRLTCPTECQASQYEALHFQMGDRVYGLNLDETAMLFLLSPSIGSGNLIIDMLNDHYRLNTASIDLDQKDMSTYKVWRGGDSGAIRDQQAIVDRYVRFYQEVPKLKKLPRHEAISISDENVKMINRACKAGILKTILDGNTVRFNVDNYLHHSDLISQPPTKGDKGPEAVMGFYTAKELRFVKRLYETYPELAQNIKFYDKGKETAAPWITHPNEWKKYQHKGAESLKKTMSALAESERVTPTIRCAALKALAAAAKDAADISASMISTPTLPSLSNS